MTNNFLESNKNFEFRPNYDNIENLVLFHYYRIFIKIRINYNLKLKFNQFNVDFWVATLSLVRQ